VLEKFASLLLHAGYQVKIFDLRTIDIPFCDGREFNVYPPHILQMHEELSQYDFFVFGMPVYQYSFS
jgi:NAD(P)H-dependent FMN reductase